MKLEDWVKVILFVSFCIGVGLVYNPGSDTVGFGVLFLVIFVVSGIVLKLGLIKGK